ncbi:DUF6185 family protein [Streptomyces tauricus]|uniref:DUF6185 family protein n=1 Tax=Streptomyces tauricus TaxID=68274 RepID=UPI0037FAE86D
MCTAVLLCLVPGGIAHAADDECFRGELKTARVTTSVRLKHNGEDYTRGTGVLTVKVPKSWSLAADLLLNGDTEPYRTAMRCLLRHPDDPFPWRDTEGRTEPPQVTVEKKWMTVEQHVTTRVINLQDRDFGPWRLTEGNRLWTLELIRPTALDGAWWQEITVDLGGRAARDVSSAPTTGATDKLTWTREKAGGDPPEVRITLQPPATKASAARWAEDPWFVFESLAWVLWSAVILTLTWAGARALRRTPVAAPVSASAADAQRLADAQRVTVRNLRFIGSLAFVFSAAEVLDDGLLAHFDNENIAEFWTDRHRTAVHLALMLLTGLLLCAFGRPGRAALSLTAAATGYVIAVLYRPTLFKLPSELRLDSGDDAPTVEWFRQAGGMYMFTLVCACAVFVWLVGTTASLLWLWRAHATPAPAFFRGRFPLTVLAALVVISTALPAVSVWTAENQWAQQSWLSSRADERYGLWHTATLFNEVRWFPSDWLDWFNAIHFWWWAPSLAILAALRARATAAAGTALLPTPPELLALKVFFVVCAAPVVGWYAGVPLAILPLLALWLALTALLAYGTKHAVLYRELAPDVPLFKVAQRYDRQKLLKDARRHRELHSQLRRLEQGQEESRRDQLEYKLDQLHRLPHPSPPTGLPNTWIRLPDSVGPVELALAWGPRAQWWENACRAALFAAVIAVPATVVQVWVDHIRDSLWEDKFLSRFGLAETVLAFVSQELIWAGVGFVLGALWRELPGRRGPVRAFWLAFVYAAPVLVHWAGVRTFDQAFGTWAFNLSLTLLVLTLTGVVMDIDTFRREGHYWPTKAGLLLSVYQWRTASFQVAFLVGQIVALVTIWQQMKGADPMVLIERDPTEGTGNGSSGP